MENALTDQDRPFKRVVALSTALGFSVMFGTMAALRRGADGFELGWHWSIPLVVAAVLLWNWRFWNMIFALQANSCREAKRKLLVQLGALVGLGILSFLYPIRFIAQAEWASLLQGLVTAVASLGILFWIMYKVGMAFTAMDQMQLDRESRAKGE